MWSLGFLKSPPINIVLWLDRAKIEAKFIVTNVLPSPPIDDVTDIIFLALSAAMYWIFVLNDLNDSVIIDFVEFGTTKLVDLSLWPISPIIGTEELFLISDFVFIVSLKNLLIEIILIGTKKAIISIKKYVNVFLGFIGFWLSSLAASITLWSDSVPALANDASYLFCWR